MDYRLLGRTGLRVSPLCLGTMNFGMGEVGGVQTEEDDGHRIMDRALELGINFFDTANVYGDGRGLTESIIGRWFAQGERRREHTVLATKVYNARDSWPNAARLSALHDPPRVRGQPPAAADRPHRPLPDAPRRPRHAVGRDLAGDGRARAAGQGALRRQQQLRRLAHRAGQRGGRRAGIRSASCRSRASTTSTPARSSSRCCPACEHYGVGDDPVEPARRWAARRRARRPGGRRSTRQRRASQDRIEEHAPAARAVGEALRRARSRRRPTSRWRGCSPTRSSPRRSSARARSSSSTARWARSTSSSTPTRWRARRDLPRPGRSRARSVRLVGAVTPWE